LDKLASENFGLTEYVRPNENIECSVAALYTRISSPVMTGVKLSVDVDGAKPEDAAAVNRVYPKDVVDLFAGEQLVVVGRYKKPGAAKITIAGHVGRGDGTDSQPTNILIFPVILVEHSSDQSQSFIENYGPYVESVKFLDQIDLNRPERRTCKRTGNTLTQARHYDAVHIILADENSRSDLSTETKAAGDRLKEFDRYADGQQGVEQRAAKHVLQQMNQPAAASPIALGKSLAGGVSGSIVDVSSAPGAASAHQVPGIEAKTVLWRRSSEQRRRNKSRAKHPPNRPQSFFLPRRKLDRLRP